jgi:hypothetical protein
MPGIAVEVATVPPSPPGPPVPAAPRPATAGPPRYLPTFAEETFIAHCYGTEPEIRWFNELMENPTDRQHMINLIVLIEEIKNRNHLGMDWKCCWRCQRFSTCEINWYRGERGMEKVCCPNCVNYRDCNKIFISQRSGKCCA